MASLRAAWKVDPSSSSLASSKDLKLDKQGIIVENVEKDDRHLPSLIDAIDRVQQKINDDLTAWKDALGNEQVDSNKKANNGGKQGQEEEDDDDVEEDEDDDEDEVQQAHDSKSGLLERKCLLSIVTYEADTLPHR